MTRHLILRRPGPQVTVQDLGRPGFLSQGLSRGGAADRMALAEGAALLGQPSTCAALEMAGTGGDFEVSAPTRIALTGAPMAATLDGRALAWNAAHLVRPGETLRVGPAARGTYGYLSIGGGLVTREWIGSRSAHLTAGLGGPLQDGQHLPLGPDPDPQAPAMRLHVDDRFGGGVVRLVPGAQTALFDEGTLGRFLGTVFRRDPQGNRQGVRLAFDGAPFSARGQRSILSEVIVPGDVQMTGDGIPVVLLPECQTTGGYPRIGSVLPEDLPIVAQAQPGAELRFRMLSEAETRAAFRPEPARFAALCKMLGPLVRDPRDIADLLGYQLIGGVTAGDLEEG